MNAAGFSGMGFKSQVALAVSIFVGLFFVEYPPIFLLGYWSWGPVAHKALSGILLVVNLVAAQYAARRLGLFSHPVSNAGEKSQRV